VAARSPTSGKFFRARAWWRLVPAPEVVGPGKGDLTAARADDGKSVYVFVPGASPARLSLRGLDLGASSAVWLNTRTGETRPDATPPATDILYTPPWPDSLLAIEPRAAP
jgi:hypothetical protein